MPTFTYNASDADGKMIRGKLSAANDLDLEERLSEQGLILLAHKELKQKGAGIFGKITAKDLIMFCVHLEQLDRAGVPLLDSLADVRDAADNPAFRDLLTEIYENVKGGDMLSVAMKKRSDVFSEVFVGLVSAGERTGKLSESFANLSAHLKWNNDLKRSIKKALMYPIILLVVMSGVIALMMLFVVPQLVDFLTSQGFELPVHTRALIATSGFFSDYWYLIFLSPIVFIVFLVMVYRFSEPGRYKIDDILLKLPFMGPVILKINLARFAHFFAVTFGSGIGVLECLDSARNVVSNRVIQDSIRQIIQNVSEGQSLTRAISGTNRFPNLVVRMFKVGEDSGNMDDALQNINFFYDREVQDSVNGMISVIQPSLTIVMGGIMFWVTAAVFGPLYDSFSKLDF